MSEDKGSDYTPVNPEPFTGNDIPRQEPFVRRPRVALDFNKEEDRLEFLYVRGKMDELIQAMNRRLPVVGFINLGKVGDFLRRAPYAPDKIRCTIESKRFASLTSNHHSEFENVLVSQVDPLLGRDGYELVIPLITDETWKRRVDALVTKEIEEKAANDTRRSNIMAQTRYQVYRDGRVVKRIFIKVGDDVSASNVPVPVYKGDNDSELMLAALSELQDRVKNPQKSQDRPYTGKDE